MSEWRKRRFGELTRVLRRGTAPVYVEASPVRAIGQRSVRNEGFDATATRPHDLRAGAVVRPETGDVLINSTGTGTIGRSCVFRDERREFMVDGHVTLVRPAGSDADGRFLNELVRSPDGQRFLESHCFTGSTNQVELSRTQLFEMPVLVPSLEEQRRIAEILDTIDETIQATARVIAKLELVRRGLRERFCTPDGSSPGPAPLSTMVESVVDCPHSTPDYLDSGVLVARTMHIKNGRFLTQAASRVSEASYRGRIARMVPAPGDVVLTREAPVGEAFAIPERMRICLGQRVVLIRPGAELLGQYLVELIYSNQGQYQIRRLSAGTTNPHLNVDDIRDLAFDVPGPETQRVALATLAAATSAIDAEQARLLKLKQTRAGLAADLLSGRVRTVAE